jgi:hypothetical protein
MNKMSKPGMEFVGRVFEGTSPDDVAAAKRVILRALINLDSLAKG